VEKRETSQVNEGRKKGGKNHSNPSNKTCPECSKLFRTKGGEGTSSRTEKRNKGPPNTGLGGGPTRATRTDNVEFEKIYPGGGKGGLSGAPIGYHKGLIRRKRNRVDNRNQMKSPKRREEIRGFGQFKVGNWASTEGEKTNGKFGTHRRVSKEEGARLEGGRLRKKKEEQPERRGLQQPLKRGGRS